MPQPTTVLVPTLRVGMHPATLRVAYAWPHPALQASRGPRDADRPGLHSHAERGNEGNPKAQTEFQARRI